MITFQDRREWVVDRSPGCFSAMDPHGGLSGGLLDAAWLLALLLFIVHPDHAGVQGAARADALAERLICDCAAAGVDFWCRVGSLDLPQSLAS
jgi:hypothetical protein